MSPLLCRECERVIGSLDEWTTRANGQRVHLLCATEDEQVEIFRRGLPAFLATLLEVS